MSGPRRRRWRDYRAPSGRRPVVEFIRALPDPDAAAVIAAMKEVAVDGLGVARHVRGAIYEVRADGDRVTYRVLFATEGRGGQVLLALEAFSKKGRRRHPRASRSPSGACGTGGLEAGDSEVDISDMLCSRRRKETLTWRKTCSTS